MRPLERIVLGTLAGMSATMIMTMAMRYGHASLPRDERYPLPPRELTERILPGSDGVTATLAHFLYGGAAGAVFSVLPRPVGGALFGPVVWAASYLGWIPMSKRLRPATQHPASRNLLMLIAHVLWGASLEMFLKRLVATSNTAFGDGPLRDAPKERELR
jgi:hypothetical protein